MTWQIGDLAVCVDGSPCRCRICGGHRSVSISAGQTFTVSGFAGVHKRIGVPMLLLVGIPYSPPGHAPGYNSARFRKVVSDKREACEPEFVTLLKRSKPKVSA